MTSSHQTTSEAPTLADIDRRQRAEMRVHYERMETPALRADAVDALTMLANTNATADDLLRLTSTHILFTTTTCSRGMATLRLSKVYLNGRDISMPLDVYVMLYKFADKYSATLSGCRLFTESQLIEALDVSRRAARLQAHTTE